MKNKKTKSKIKKNKVENKKKQSRKIKKKRKQKIKNRLVAGVRCRSSLGCVVARRWGALSLVAGVRCRLSLFATGPCRDSRPDPVAKNSSVFPDDEPLSLFTTSHCRYSRRAPVAIHDEPLSLFTTSPCRYSRRAYFLFFDFVFLFLSFNIGWRTDGFTGSRRCTSWRHGLQ